MSNGTFNGRPIDEIEIYVENDDGSQDFIGSVESMEHTAYADESLKTPDSVNSPGHYTAGKLEVIEIIEQTVAGYEDPFVAHCVGTTTKYLNRAPHKHDDPTEDLRKAAAYLNFAVDHLTKGNGDDGSGS